MRAIPERLRDALCGGAIQIDYFYLFCITGWMSQSLSVTQAGVTQAECHRGRVLLRLGVTVTQAECHSG